MNNSRPLDDGEKALLPGRKTRALTLAERVRELPADADQGEVRRAISASGARWLDGSTPGACPKCQCPMEQPEIYPNGFAISGCLWCRFVVVGRGNAN